MNKVYDAIETLLPQTKLENLEDKNQNFRMIEL